ncbi:MAG: TetR/AcrR family transcriptional regulator [Erysipelotrichaceae bacterium]|nr:TetR/AcrR family transcriptional regulator [Erysipelotrichaceae bacterium]
MKSSSELSKEYLADSLILLMKKKEFKKITNKDITDKAGLSHITIYRNFNSKEEIIAYWLNAITKEFLDTSKLSYRNDNTQEYFIKLFTHLEKYKNEIKLIYNAGLIYLLKDVFEKYFIKGNTEYNTYKSYFIIGGIYNVFYYWVINDFKETPEFLSSMLIDILSK